MANLTAYNPRGTASGEVIASFSFLGNGAAQVIETQVYGAKGILGKPFSGAAGLNRTGIGAYTVNLRDRYFGEIPFGGANIVQQGIIGFFGSVFQAAAATIFVVPIFTGTDLQVAKQLKFVIENQAGTAVELTASMLCCVTMIFDNSSGA